MVIDKWLELTLSRGSGSMLPGKILGFYVALGQFWCILRAY